MIRQHGRWIVYKGGSKRQYQWCCARVDKGMLNVIYQHEDWDAVMKVATLSSEGRIDEFGKWLTDYHKTLLKECSRSLARLALA